MTQLERSRAGTRAQRDWLICVPLTAVQRSQVCEAPGIILGTREMVLGKQTSRKLNIQVLIELIFLMEKDKEQIYK